MSDAHGGLQAGSLTLWDGIALMCGDIIGSGIFASPGIALGLVAAPLWSLSLWLIGGALTLAGTLCLMELSAAHPDAGGVFAYLRLGFGDAVAFSWQWINFTVIGPGSISALALTMAQYLAGLFSEGVDMAEPSLSVKLLAVLVLLIAGLGNCFRASGIAEAARFFVVNATVACAVVVALAVRTLAFGDQAAAAENFVARHDVQWDLSGAALISILWSYAGWTDVPGMAEELVDPTRTLPKVAVCGTLMISTMYFVMNTSYMVVLPQSVLTTSGSLGVAFARAASGGQEWVANLMAVLVCISSFGGTYNCLFFMGRQYYATARAGLFPEFLKLTTSDGAPWAAVMTSTVWGATLLLALPNFQTIVNYLSFTLWIFYGAIGALVVILRHRLPDAHRPFKVPFYPFLPVGFAIASWGTTLSLLVGGDLISCVISLLFLLAAFPIYRCFFAAASTKQTELMRSMLADLHS
jgi:amino acid transporter